MPRSRKVSDYPQYVLDIATSLTNGEKVEIRNPIKRSLENIRFAFYGFRKAVERENARDMFPNLHRVEVRIYAERGQGAASDHAEWVLAFEDADQTPLAQSVRKALGFPKATIPTAHITPLSLQPTEEIKRKTTNDIFEELLNNEREKKK